MAEKVTMVIDCDPGIDDAVAIMMALSQPHVDVIAVTCVKGNVSMDKLTVNALRILKKFNRLDIPVFAGVTNNIIGAEFHAKQIHGIDGLGDLPNPDPPSSDLVQSEHAVQALIRMANEKPGQITLVAIGPLTNVSFAMRLDPTFTSKLKEMVIMGGNISARGTGFPSAEFNFGTDPEAALIVLQETKCPTILLPLETCMAHAIPYEWFTELSRNERPVAQFMAAFTKNMVAMSRRLERPSHMIADGCAMVVAARRDAVKESIQSPCRVELQGTLTRGQMLTMKNSPWMPDLPGPKICIVTQFDMDLYYQMLSEAIK